jgi:DNA polymerase III gamma/tau subunit
LSKNEKLLLANQLLSKNKQISTDQENLSNRKQISEDILIDQRKKEILVNKYYQILGIPEISTIKEILIACQKGDGRFAYRTIHKLVESGYDISDLLDILTRVLIYLPEFPSKDQFLRMLCRDTYTIQECYTETQLHNLINHMVKIGLNSIDQ